MSPSNISQAIMQHWYIRFLPNLVYTLVLSVSSSCMLSGHVQDWEHMQCLGTCRAPMYLQGVTQGEWVPAECLSRSVIMYKSKYIHRGTLPDQSRSEKKAAFSFYSSPALYN